MRERRLTTPPRIDLALVAVIFTTLLTVNAVILVLGEAWLLAAGEVSVFVAVPVMAGASVAALIFGRWQRWAVGVWFREQPREPLDQRLRDRR